MHFLYLLNMCLICQYRIWDWLLHPWATPFVEWLWAYWGVSSSTCSDIHRRITTYMMLRSRHCIFINKVKTCLTTGSFAAVLTAVGTIGPVLIHVGPRKRVSTSSTGRLMIAAVSFFPIFLGLVKCTTASQTVSWSTDVNIHWISSSRISTHSIIAVRLLLIT